MRGSLESAEVCFRRLNITTDLRAEQFRRIEFPFIPNTLQKLQSCRSRCGGDSAMEYMGFDSFTIFAKRRSNADVGDRIDEILRIDGNPCDVDASARDQFVVRSEIESRYRDTASTPRAFFNTAFDFKPTPQKATGS